MCALGCVDSKVGERLNTYYNNSSGEQRIDFNMCHPIWRKFYITIDPPSQDNKVLYYAIGSTAALVNIAALSIGFLVIYKLTGEKVLNEANDSEIDEGWKAKLTSFKKCFMILLPVMLQVMDSVLDALYFIKLKTSFRIIHVQPFVHVLQALLLFTCK